MIITIIFIAEDGNPVHIRFTKNAELPDKYHYGRWNVTSNEIELNEDGWRIFETHRKEVRKLKPLLDQLDKFSA